MSIFHNLRMRLGLFSYLKVINHYPDISHIEDMIYL